MKKIIIKIAFCLVVFAQKASAQLWNVNVGNPGPGIWLGTNNNTPLDLRTNSSTRMYILQDGRVGIGTTTPLAKLDLAGGNMAINGNNILLRDGNDANHGMGWFGGGKLFAGQSLDGPAIYGFSRGALGTKDVGANTEKIALLWDRNGNIAIGTDFSNNTYNNIANYYKLSVNGAIRAKEVVIETTWSDFVFHKNYKLPTLDEVENYIHEHGHLPEIPSAEEVEKNGGNLGELLKLQMQKIEELTLYLIDQNKKMQQMQKELDELKQKK